METKPFLNLELSLPSSLIERVSTLMANGAKETICSEDGCYHVFDEFFNNPYKVKRQDADFYIRHICHSHPEACELNCGSKK